VPFFAGKVGYSSVGYYKDSEKSTETRKGEADQMPPREIKKNNASIRAALKRGAATAASIGMCGASGFRKID